MANDVAVVEDKEVAPPGGKQLPASPEDTNKLEEMLGKRNMTKQEFQVIRDVIFPNAVADRSIFLAIDYCRARKLDVMKRTVHIVPVWSKKEGKLVDTVWPGIAEHRITAHRTGRYAGNTRPEYGPLHTKKWTAEKKSGGTKKVVEVEVTFPEWGRMTVYRLVEGVKCAFEAEIHWLEAYKTVAHDSPCPNDRWEKAPFDQFAKCLEAAALRMAFPEECSDPTAEEMEGAVIYSTADEGGKVTMTGIANTVAERAQEIANSNAAHTVEGEIVEPTHQEKMQATAEIAEKLGTAPETVQAVAALAKGIDGKQSMQLMAAGKKKGWTAPQVISEIKKQYSLGANWQKEMTERQYREFYDHVSSYDPPKAE